jgi:uncharacterized membrane protein YsdA (DUF1294 family)|tara:strand:- start:210 stop:449 length:240 start_codon:yes stop_codon:yes gene_type:complete
MRPVLVVACACVCYDKFASKHSLARVPENAFYLLAFVGDAAALVATLLCLWAANHKTRKSSFKLRWAAAAAAGLLFKYS